jgi:hypothetical protein
VTSRNTNCSVSGRCTSNAIASFATPTYSAGCIQDRARAAYSKGSPEVCERPSLVEANSMI